MDDISIIECSDELQLNPSTIKKLIQNAIKCKNRKKKRLEILLKQTQKENKMYNILLEFRDNDGQREYIIENATEYNIEQWDICNEIEIKTNIGEYFKLPFTSGKVSVREVGTDKVEVKLF